MTTPVAEHLDKIAAILGHGGPPIVDAELVRKWADLYRAVHQLRDEIHAQPRTWSLPPEPGPEVTAVRDAGGERWTLYEDGFWRVAQIRRRWGSLLAEFGPLTDATGEPR